MVNSRAAIEKDPATRGQQLVICRVMDFELLNQSRTIGERRLTSISLID
jgi:hypothetical protein